MFSGDGDEPLNTTGKPDISREKSLNCMRGENIFPRRVNSPVRAFNSVYGTPLFIEKGDGCQVWDADGNQFIDFAVLGVRLSWGIVIRKFGRK